jgi:hypothetical protein
MFRRIADTQIACETFAINHRKLSRYLKKHTDPHDGPHYQFWDVRRDGVCLPSVMVHAVGVNGRTSVLLDDDISDRGEDCDWPGDVRFLDGDDPLRATRATGRELVSTLRRNGGLEETAFTIVAPTPKWLGGHGTKVFVALIAFSGVSFYGVLSHSLLARRLVAEIRVLTHERNSLETLARNIPVRKDEIRLLRKIDRSKNEIVEGFSRCCKVCDGFDFPIWLDKLTLSADNTLRSVPGCSRHPSLSRSHVDVCMMGRMRNSTTSVEELKGRFSSNLKYNNPNLTKVMNLDLGLKESPGEETGFVCSLLLEPEDYL